MIKEQRIETFLDALSSKQPVPGGGGASALSGALASALGLMVGNLTIGKKKYAAVEADVQDGMRCLEQLQREMVSLADRDAQVFAPLAAAYSLPAGTEEEKAYKEQVMEKNLLLQAWFPWRLWKKQLPCWES